MWYVIKNKDGTLSTMFLTLEQVADPEIKVVSLPYFDKIDAEDALLKRKHNSGRTVINYDNYARMIEDWQAEEAIVQPAR